MATAYLNGNIFDSSETPPFADPKEWDLYKIVAHREGRRKDYVVYIWAPNNIPAIKGSDYARNIYMQRFSKKDETIEVKFVRNATQKRHFK